MKPMVPLIVLSIVFSACGTPVSEQPMDTQTTAISNEELVQKIAGEAGLAVIDLSVPFERIGEAPQRLQHLAKVLSRGLPGVYVLRYYDDTLQYTHHLFVVSPSSRAYIALTSLPTEKPTRNDYEVSSAGYDESTKSLILKIDSGELRLVPEDVTPVGA